MKTLLTDHLTLSVVEP